MKKIFMGLAFLAIMPMVVSSQEAPITMQVNVAQQVEWRGDSMTEVIHYFNDSRTAQQSIDCDILVVMLESLFHLQPFIKDKINPMAVIFANRFNDALKDSDTARGEKNVNELKSYLESKGKFIANMYNASPKNYPWITTEVALRGTTFGSEYRKEYFLTDDKGKKIDNEKQDNLEYFFYSEQTQKPGMARVLGFGYVDKRSWKKYLFEKAKYPAVVGALGYGAYKGLQTERGQQWMQSVQESEPYKYVADSQAGKWVGENIKPHVEHAISTAREFPGKIKEFPERMQGYFNYYYTKRDERKIENIEKKQDEIRNKLESLGSQVGKGIWTDKKVVSLQRQFAKLEGEKKVVLNKNVGLQEMKESEAELKGIRKHDDQRWAHQKQQEVIVQTEERRRKQDKEEALIRQEQGNLEKIENERSGKTQQDQQTVLDLKERLAREKQARLNQQREQQQRSVIVPDQGIQNTQININQEEISLLEKERLAKEENLRLEQESKRLKEEQKLLRHESKRIRDNKRLAQEIERMKENDIQRDQYQQERERQQKVTRLESQLRRKRALIMPIQQDIERDNYLERINRRNKLSSERVKRLRRISGEGQL